MDGIIAVINYLHENATAAILLEVIAFCILWGLAGLLWMVHRDARSGRAALHKRITTSIHMFHQHERECAERWGQIKKHMDVVEKRLDKVP